MQAGSSMDKSVVAQVESKIMLTNRSWSRRRKQPSLPALICFVTLTRARGGAARCRPTCSTCWSRLGGAAAAGRTMVSSTAAPSADFHCAPGKGTDLEVEVLS